jgi:hypothetical protein
LIVPQWIEIPGRRLHLTRSSRLAAVVPSRLDSSLAEPCHNNFFINACIGQNGCHRLAQAAER